MLRLVSGQSEVFFVFLVDIVAEEGRHQRGSEAGHHHHRDAGHLQRGKLTWTRKETSCDSVIHLQPLMFHLLSWRLRCTEERATLSY